MAKPANKAWVLNDHSRVESTVGGNVIDKIRQQLHCKFCGGKSCKHEDWTRALKRKNSHVAIRGLHSNWVEDWVVASQRPSTGLIKEHGIIEQFKEARVAAIFNLQEQGEHPFCGPDGCIYAESGYSYVPEVDLMPHGICHYSFPWPDMCAPSFDIVLRTVQVMCDHVSKGERFLVHCHAGLGRTGLMIACWAMYHRYYTPNEVVLRIRAQRPGSIQTKRQLQFVFDFYSYLKGMRCIYRTPSTQESLSDHLSRQAALLHGQEARALRHVPKLLHLALTRVLDIVDEEFHVQGTTFQSALVAQFVIDSVNHRRRHEDHVHITEDKVFEGQVSNLKSDLNNGKWTSLQKTSDLALLVRVLLDMLFAFKEPCIHLNDIRDGVRKYISKGYLDSHVRSTVASPASTESNPQIRVESSTASSKSTPLLNTPTMVSPPLTPSLRQGRPVEGGYITSKGTRVFNTSGKVNRLHPPLGSPLESKHDFRPEGIGVPATPLSGSTRPRVASERRQMARTQRSALRQMRDEKSVDAERLASVLLDSLLVPYRRYTAGVLLSALWLIIWDQQRDVQLDVISAGVEALCHEDIRRDKDLVEFFHTAAQEYGDTYFNRPGGNDSEKEESEPGNYGTVHVKWLAMLYHDHTSLRECPYSKEDDVDDDRPSRDEEGCGDTLQPPAE
eukprot:Sspe_Gene.117165::Locus_107882_Transcript_1_1_Confidence_1.000_Length_2109::g.117165::m.117165/K18078/PTPDC1; protein tyrosine phosphatase domain-containing protein 1